MLVPIVLMKAFNVDVVITENPGIVCIGFVLPDELLTNFDVVVSDGDVFPGVSDCWRII